MKSHIVGLPREAPVHLHVRELLPRVLRAQAREDAPEVPGPEAGEDRLPRGEPGARNSIVVCAVNFSPRKGNDLILIRYISDSL